MIVDAYDGWAIDQVKQRCRELCRLSMAKDLRIEELLDALKGVVAVADRKTDEFDKARAAIAKARRPS